MNFTMRALTAAALGLHWSRFMVMFSLCYGFVMAAASARKGAVLWLPCQPGENRHVCSPYGSLSLLPAS